MTFDKISRLYGAFLLSIGMLAGATTFVMMLLVVTNVISRYVFKSEISGAFEITQSMLTVLVFFSLALAQYRDSHIRVVLLTDHLRPAVEKVIRIVGLLIGAVFFAWCTYATFNFAVASYEIGELEWGSIQYPIYPVKFAVSFGLLLLSIQFVFSAIHIARTVSEPAESISTQPESDAK